MPQYFFHLTNGVTVEDTEGESFNLPAEARGYAVKVAQELGRHQAHSVLQGHGRMRRGNSFGRQFDRDHGGSEGPRVALDNMPLDGACPSRAFIAALSARLRPDLLRPAV